MQLKIVEDGQGTRHNFFFAKGDPLSVFIKYEFVNEYAQLKRSLFDNKGSLPNEELKTAFDNLLTMVESEMRAGSVFSFESYTIALSHMRTDMIPMLFDIGAIPGAVAGGLAVSAATTLGMSSLGIFGASRKQKPYQMR